MAGSFQAMSSPRVLRVLALSVLCLAVPGVSGSARAQGSIGDVADCAIRNLPPSAHAHATLVTRSRGGQERTTDIEYWSMTSPEGTRRIVIKRVGAAATEISTYLFSDGSAIGEAWSYKAKDKNPKKLAAAGPDWHLFGTNVTLEDFARFARVVFPGQVRRLADAEVSGRKAYVIETKPAPDAGSEYSRIVTSIDKEWCLILRRESYEKRFEKGEHPRKIYSVEPKDVRIDDKFANAGSAKQEDAKDGSTTMVQVTKLEIPTNVDESFFTPSSLPQAH
jgi:hypothetical protein